MGKLVQRGYVSGFRSQFGCSISNPDRISNAGCNHTSITGYLGINYNSIINQILKSAGLSGLYGGNRLCNGAGSVAPRGWAGGGSHVRSPILRLAAALVFVFAISVSAVVGVGAAQAQPQTFTIPAQSVEGALREFGQQADIDVEFALEDVAGLTSPGVSGAATQREAAAGLLDGTGLTYTLEEGLLIVRLAAEGDGRINSIAPNGVAKLAQASGARGRAAADDYDYDDDEESIEEVVVTGSHIRGIAPDSSPMRTYTRQDILNSGVSTMQDFIQTLPQNFGGGSNAGARALPNDENAGFNDPFQGGTLGSSVNLRGLGSGSTLVLLNGHRLAPSSGIGDFVDISMIPASAIERVEVLTDGASSIYGGDAVAGVVNFILRDDFDGVEASFRYGSVTEGDLDEYRASITGGTSWNKGNALFVYEYFNQGDLSAEDRSFSQGAPLPYDLLPSQERHSVLASARQELNSTLEIFSDFLYSHRKTEFNITDSAGNLLNSNSFSDYTSFSAGGSWKVTDTWFVDFSGTYSGVHNKTDTSGDAERMKEVDSDVWTADARASGTLMHLPGGDLKLVIGGQYRTEGFRNFDVLDDEIDREADRDIYALFGEAFIPIIGSDNAIPGVQRLEVNVSGRFEDNSDFGSTTNPKVGVLWSPLGDLRLRGSYSTSFNPPPLGRVGSVDFRASAVPSSLFNAIFGLTPGDPSIADVVMITVFGTDKDLDAERSTTFAAGLDLNKKWGRHDLTFTTTWFDIDFENRLGSTPIPGNSIVFDAPNIAFNNPELFPEGTVTFFPSQSEIQNLIDSLDNLGVFPGLDPLDAEIINLAAVVRNLARTSVSGFDFDVAYAYDSDIGILSLGVAATFLQNFKQQAAISTPIVEQVDTLYSPVDLKLRGRAGYVHNGFAANLFLNYTDDYRVDNTVGATKIDSWTTVDANLSYDTQQRFGNSILNNAVLRLSVRNLFNENPPSTPGDPVVGIFGFDPTNASSLGRFISFELTKKF